MSRPGQTILAPLERFDEYGLGPWAVVVCDCMRVHEVAEDVRLVWCECGRRLLVERGEP